MAVLRQMPQHDDEFDVGGTLLTLRRRQREGGAANTRKRG